MPCFFFYRGKNKNPETMSDSEWARRSEQINWVLRYTGVVEVKQKDLELEHKEEIELIGERT